MNGRHSRVGAHAYHKAGGFTYIGILFAVAFIGVGLAVVGQVWSITARRADEEQLLFVGDAFRSAIASYYRSGPGRQYPPSLEALVLDERTPVPMHHLRKIYVDPMTGKRDWTLLTLDDGSIVGVASSSQRKPIKRANFGLLDASFEDAECYCDWAFVYMPSRALLRTLAKKTATAR